MLLKFTVLCNKYNGYLTEDSPSSGRLIRQSWASENADQTRVKYWYTRCRG